jgi:hypothetical protein
MRLRTSTAVLLALGAAVLSAAPAGGDSSAFPSARAGSPWTAVIRAQRRPAVSARNGVTVQPVAVRRAGRARYRLRAVFPFSGRWELRAGRRRLGAVTVRPAPRLASGLPGADAFRLCAGGRPADPP